MYNSTFRTVLCCVRLRWVAVHYVALQDVTHLTLQLQTHLHDIHVHLGRFAGDVRNVSYKGLARSVWTNDDIASGRWLRWCVCVCCAITHHPHTVWDLINHVNKWTILEENQSWPWRTHTQTHPNRGVHKSCIKHMKFAHTKKTHIPHHTTIPVQ